MVLPCPTILFLAVLNFFKSYNMTFFCALSNGKFNTENKNIQTKYFKKFTLLSKEHPIDFSIWFLLLNRICATLFWCSNFLIPLRVLEGQINFTAPFVKRKIKLIGQYLLSRSRLSYCECVLWIVIATEQESSVSAACGYGAMRIARHDAVSGREVIPWTRSRHTSRLLFIRLLDSVVNECFDQLVHLKHVPYLETCPFRKCLPSIRVALLLLSFNA